MQYHKLAYCFSPSMCVLHGSLEFIENSIIQIWSNSMESVYAKVQYI